MRIRNGDVELEVTIDGDDGAPPLVLLHGIISSSRTWDWVVPKLAGSFRVIRLDFRGHGGSDRAPGAYQLPNYLSDAVAVCEQVAGVPAAVIGHSLGGVTAAALAQQRPDLVRAALLEDAPLAVIGPDAGDGENPLFDAFRLMRQSIPQLQAGGATADDLTQMMALMPTAAGATFGEVCIPDGLHTMAIGLLAVDASVLDPVLEGAMGRSFDAEQPITVPVIAVAADCTMPDAVTRPEDLEKLVATSPQVDTATVANTGHLIHDSKTGRDEFSNLVDRFLGSLA